jgi:hypothetical protein
MHAGRELDEKVARLVWPERRWWPATSPRYSTDVAAAMMLLDTLAEQGWVWSLSYGRPTTVPDRPDPYVAWLCAPMDDAAVIANPRAVPRMVTGTAPTLPLAVCRCVIAALEDA